VSFGQSSGSKGHGRSFRDAGCSSNCSPVFISRLADKTEQHEVLQEQLHQNEKYMAELQDERTKTSREGSSRLANLNQALMKLKQSVSQLSEENVTLKNREQELVERCESLEHQLAHGPQEANGVTGGPLAPSTPTRRPHTCQHPSTPARPIPGETKLESLQTENEKLKKELQCMQTNFQLMSQKSATVKKEKKEIEQSLAELQAEFDRILTEKTSTETKLEETRASLSNKLSTVSTSQKKQEELEQEISSLQSELSQLVSQTSQLDEQLETEKRRSESSEEFARQLQEKAKNLKEWKVQAESKIATLTSQLRALEEELADHRSSKTAQFSQQRQESEAIAAYKQKLERIRGERRELEERLGEAGQALEEEHIKNSLLEKANKALKRQRACVESVQRELQEHKEHGSGLSREVSELSDRLAAVTEENALLREECDRLEGEQKQTMEQIEGLTRSRQEHCERAESQEGVVRNLQDQLRRQEYELSSVADAVREKRPDASPSPSRWKSSNWSWPTSRVPRATLRQRSGNWCRNWRIWSRQTLT
jgi:chromosome segregation ATPase